MRKKKGFTMNRRQLLTGGLLAAATAGFVYRDAISTIVVGHTKDAITRVTHDDEILQNVAIERTGSFDQTATGRDPAHWADGSVSIVEKENTSYIQLEADFNSGPLPDGWVCVHTGTNLQDETDTLTDDLTYIAPLKAGVGASYYELPEGIEFNSVVIVCRKFQQYIGAATLTQ